LFVKGEETSGSLREDLKLMPVRSPHRTENPLNVFNWYLVVKEIAHRIYENTLRFFPVERQVKCIRVRSKFKAVSVLALPHRF
jgi:hypothetical protein